jgi:type II secretory pathway pseudopilin PulG
MHTRRGFTLVEISLIVAAIGIIAATVIVALNPGRQIAEARDHQRRTDVATIWNAVQQYALNNPGDIPDAIPQGTLEEDCLGDPVSEEFTICKTDSCAVILTELVDDGAYLTSIPVDPLAAEDEDYSGYNIIRDTDHNNRVTVCAPATEGEEPIYLPR